MSGCTWRTFPTAMRMTTKVMKPAPMPAVIEKVKTQKGIQIEHQLVEGANHFFDGRVEELMGTVDTFSMWVYNAEPTTERLRVEFGRGATTDTAFEFGLDFTGWRTCWVRLGYDTDGTAHHAMNRVRFIA